MNISEILLGVTVIGAIYGTIQLALQIRNKFRSPPSGNMDRIFERTAEIFSLEKINDENKYEELIKELEEEFGYFKIAETGIDTLFQPEDRSENLYLGNLWSKSRFESGTIDNYTFLCIYRKWNLEDKLFIQKKMFAEKVTDFLSTTRKRKVRDEFDHFEDKFFINSEKSDIIQSILTPDVQEFILEYYNKYPFNAMDKGPGGIVIGSNKIMIVCRNMKKQEHTGKMIEFGRKFIEILDAIIVT